MCVNNWSKVALDSAAAGIDTRDLQSQVQRPNRYATELYIVEYIMSKRIVGTFVLNILRVT